MHPDPAPSSAGKVSLHLHACSTLRLRSAFAFACQRHGMLGRSRQIYIPCFHTECHQANSRPDRDQIFAFPHLVPQERRGSATNSAPLQACMGLCGFEGGILFSIFIMQI